MSQTRFSALDLNLLRVFDAVMAERNLTRAAHKLALTQPAVSNAMRRLRQALGDELVRRGASGVEPTPHALAIWPVVREALLQLQTALIPENFDPAHTQTSFVVSMADATAAMLMPAMVEMLENEAPGVSLRVVPLTTRDPRSLLDEEAADLAVGYFPLVLAEIAARGQTGQAQRYLHELLYEGDYVCVMRRDHPLATQPAAQSMSLAQYCAARHLLVSFSGRSYGVVDEALAALGRQRHIVLTVNQFATAGRVVAKSNLLAVLPQHFIAATGMAQALAERPLPFAAPSAHVAVLWHRRMHDHGAHQWLRQLVVRAARQAFDQPLQPKER